MRVAAIYDIHGNLPALESVIHEIRQEAIDLIVVGGDVVPGPMPTETFDCLQSLEIPMHFIRGNGDREVLARFSGIETDWFRTAPEQWRAPVRWTAEQLRTCDAKMLANWPATLQMKIEGIGALLFCHATPLNDTDCFTRLTSDETLSPIFEQLEVDVVVCGHTHMQFDRMIGNVRVINAGSVGMPYGRPGAHWLSLGPELQLRRTEFDLTEAAQRIRDSRYIQAEEFAAKHVVRPPTEESILEIFASIELGSNK